jgi:ribose-phosphate pyrophosphokinase
MLIFALSETHLLGNAVAARVGKPLTRIEERSFEDGEHKSRPLESVRGADAYVLQSLDGEDAKSPNDKLVRMLFFAATLKENGARRVTAIIPYLAYARKERQTKPRDPVTTRYMAQLIEAAGVDAVVGLDAHNVAAFQNAFRRPTIHLDTRRLFSERAAALVGDRPAVVVSPDPGGVKRAQLFREMLERKLGRAVGFAFIEKRRSAGIVSGDLLCGEVSGAIALVMDDLVASGGTLARAAAAILEAGASEAYAFAAHGLFVGDADRTLREAHLTKLIITDSAPPRRLSQATRSAHVEVLSIAPLLADAIRILHEGGSITALLGDES